MDRSLARTIVALAAVPLLLVPALARPGPAAPRPLPEPPSAAPQAPFEKLGQAFLERHCGKGASLQDCDLPQVLAERFAHLRLGAFDLHYPASALGDRAGAEALGEMAIGLLDLQDRLLGWLALEAELAAEVTADVSTLRAWVASWKPAELARVAKADDKQLLVALAAGDEVREAAARLRATLADRRSLGLAPQFVDGVGVLACPSRREFMETLGYLGLSDPEWRRQHWVEGADQWTQCWKGPLLVLALEYAPMKGADPEFRSSLSPSALDKDGRLQHVLNQTARALLFRIFNRPELAHLERALAANLVIETAGRIMVLDGEGEIRSSGGETQPYERFVPGGNPSGGLLPPISAAPLDHLVSSRWRRGKGEDWFLGVLREGQADGFKVAKKDRKNPKRKDKLAHFLLDSDGKGEEWLVSAPFIGTYASEQAYPPPEYLNDYREFFKTYQTAFYRWLRTEAVEGSPEESRGNFDEFLRILATPGNQETPAAALERAYGLPASARDGSVDSLEWRFLAWIAEKRK